MNWATVVKRRPGKIKTASEKSSGLSGDEWAQFQGWKAFRKQRRSVAEASEGYSGSSFAPLPSKNNFKKPKEESEAFRLRYRSSAPKGGSGNFKLTHA